MLNLEKCHILYSRYRVTGAQGTVRVQNKTIFATKFSIFDTPPFFSLKVIKTCETILYVLYVCNANIYIAYFADTQVQASRSA